MSGASGSTRKGGAKLVVAGTDLLEQAVEKYESVLEKKPDDPQLLNSLARTLCLLKRFEEALPHARRAVEIESDPNCRDTLAHAAYGTGNWQEAADARENVLKARPNYFNQTDEPPNCRADKEHYQEAKRRAAEVRKKRKTPDKSKGLQKGERPPSR
jgi:tetratricopeptide (TPR) repeat protein